jgi:hypothetical protein
MESDPAAVTEMLFLSAYVPEEAERLGGKAYVAVTVLEVALPKVATACNTVQALMERGAV